MGSLPALLERARQRQEAQAEFEETLETFPSLLPARRQSPYSAWVAISVGCNNTCTFCIVPSLRGKEKDRRPGDILDEIRGLVADGAVEVTAALSPSCCAPAAPLTGSSGSGSPPRTRATSPTT
jgi:tRNA-2-methylthio-N6-dimethylallyladenosine synthase